MNVARFEAAGERRSARPEVMRTIINNSNLTLFFSLRPQLVDFTFPGRSTPVRRLTGLHPRRSWPRLNSIIKKKIAMSKARPPPARNGRPTLFFPFDNKPAMLIISFNGTVCFYFTVFLLFLPFLLAIFPGGCSFSCALRFRVSIFIFPSREEYTSWSSRARWWYFNWFHLIAFVAFHSATSSTHSR